jgi:spore maturation protein CgeB
VNRYPSLRFPPDRPDTYSRLRDIEAPMAGACYLTEWTEGLDRLYDLGTEIDTYRDAAELVAKVASLSADPARRCRLRAAAQRRALSDHSISRTLARIAERLCLTG